MRLIPALVLAAALSIPAVASAACDEAAVQKLSNEMMTAAQAFAATNPTPAQQQDMQNRMLELQKKTGAAANNPEEACKVLQSIIDELKK